MSQNPILLPTTGTVSGLQIVQDINAALDTLNTQWSGSSPPASPESFQDWLDTSTTPPTRRVYDGSQWVAVGALDTANHLWIGSVGGGAASLASAATTDLGSVPQACVTITGTTAISALGSSAEPGQIKFVTFAGALTLTYTATSLILPGAASLLTQAGDTAVFEYLGSGDWRCLSYQPAAIAPAAGLPSGAIVPYAGSAAPTGWLLCYGQALSRTTYAALFAAIGTTYGAGDGSTTFNLPDLRGRTIAGVDNMGGATAGRITSGNSGIAGTTLGAVGGDERLHSHAHTDAGHLHASAGAADFVTTNAGIGGYAWQLQSGSFTLPNQSGFSYPSTTADASANITSTGSGSSQNMQPTMMLNYIIKQ